jgi:hypothetical protein
MKSLYDTDFHEWALHNAELLRTGRLREADVAHIVEELEGLSINERRELQRRLRVLLMHLLKWSIAAGDRSASWQATIDVQRADIEDLLEQSPSLRRLVPDLMNRVYARAASEAVREMGLLQNPFSAQCPSHRSRSWTQRFSPITTNLPAPSVSIPHTVGFSDIM